MVYSLLNEHLKKSGIEASAMTRLAGATNHVFLINSQQGQFVIKIPKTPLLGLINRENEYFANQLAAAAGISLPFYYFDLASGVNITRYLSGSQVLTSSLIQQEKNIQIVALLLKQVHGLPEKFLENINIFKVIKTYKTRARQNLPVELNDIFNYDKRIQQLQQQLEKLPASKVPCHGDAILSNFLQTNTGQFYLIDWEYAGNNDPCWDLATVSVEAKFNPQQDQLFLNYYFNTPSAEEMLRFRSYKILCDYLWAFWCIVMSDYENAQRRWQNLAKSSEKS